MVIWWRGNGLLIGFLAFLPALAATQLGASRVALAYFASAAIIYLLRNSIGESSALFSIPTRFWPPALLLIALLVHFSPTPKKKDTTKKVEDVVAEIQASLPRTLGTLLRIDKVTYTKDTLYYKTTSLVPFSSDGMQKSTAEKEVSNHYCSDLAQLWQSKFSLDVSIIIPPKTLNERLSTENIRLQPAACNSKQP